VKQVLVGWGIAEPQAKVIAEALAKIKTPNWAYESPLKMFQWLKLYFTLYPVAPLEIRPHWEIIRDFFEWLWGVIRDAVAYVSLIMTGALITWVVPDWYKMFGVIPIVAGVYLALKKAKVI